MSLYAKYVPVALGGGGGGGIGTVTSVGLADGSGTPIYSISGSPVTGAGTLTFTLATQGANLVFAGPTTGSAAQPGFRSLVAADLPTGNLTDVGTDGITIGNGSGAVIGTGTTISQHVADTSHNGYLASADWNTFNGKQATGNYATSGTGDVSWSAPSGAGPVTTSLVATTNATLTTLSALTTAGSLATVGTVTSGTWNATTIAIAHGGTGQTSAAAAFAALSPLTTQGDIIYETSAPAPARLAIGSTGNVLTVSGGIPAWAPPATSGTVTSVAAAGPTGIATWSAAITGSGTLTQTLSNQTANTVLAGPSSGGAVAPTFRALVGADLPNPSSSTLGGVQSLAAVSSNWIRSISTAGVPAASQPAFTDISGTATIGQGGTGQTSITTGGTGNGSSPAIASGTYSPVLTGVTNVSAITSGAWQWMRVGNVFNLSGRVIITPTTGASATTFTASLPFSFTGNPTTGQISGVIVTPGLNAFGNVEINAGATSFFCSLNSALAGGNNYDLVVTGLIN